MTIRKENIWKLLFLTAVALNKMKSSIVILFFITFPHPEILLLEAKQKQTVVMLERIIWVRMKSHVHVQKAQSRKASAVFLSITHRACLCVWSWSWLFGCVSADWLKQQQLALKTIICCWSGAVLFFFFFLGLIGWLGPSPGILVTHRPADVTALHNEVWAYLAAFVNNQAGKFTGDKSDIEGHVCHDVI